MVYFAHLDSDGTLTEERDIPYDKIRACPFHILTAEHYTLEGFCKCMEPREQARLIRECGFVGSDFSRLGIRRLLK